jgi:hypothetical protein
MVDGFLVRSGRGGFAILTRAVALSRLRRPTDVWVGAPRNAEGACLLVLHAREARAAEQPGQRLAGREVAGHLGRAHAAHDFPGIDEFHAGLAGELLERPLGGAGGNGEGFGLRGVRQVGAREPNRGHEQKQESAKAEQDAVLGHSI